MFRIVILSFDPALNFFRLSMVLVEIGTS
jgi:hypothetical protein